MEALRNVQFSQEKIVFVIAVLMFVVFSVTLKGFLNAGNIISLVQNVSILGVLGIGMALTIIGRGIDLSMVANMAISVAWVLYLANHGMPLPVAILCGLALSLAIGLLNGVLIAYVEIPAIFATLAMGTAVYGFGHSMLVNSDLIFMPKSDPWFKAIGGSSAWACRAPSFGWSPSVSWPSCSCVSRVPAVSSTASATTRSALASPVFRRGR